MNDIEEIDARPLLTRRMAWDMLPHNISLAVLRRMDMVPPADDSLLLEHADSHVRQDDVLRLQAELRAVLPIAKQVLCAAMLVGQDDCETPLSEAVIGEIVRASCVGVLSYLVNQEVVQVNDGSGR